MGLQTRACTFAGAALHYAGLDIPVLPKDLYELLFAG